ncbi:MAG: DNA-directed RNA polymerase subunit P [Candidatus Aenigmarchaeota archaeon ex4484_56]|nr:MAG: DNA-directed RNA polymerase subunit P [Candidatus Aenigmarchaeota archaeon ex4484_56]
MTYTCLNCGGFIEKIEDSVICPHCGYRILVKNRISTIKKVLAR